MLLRCAIELSIRCQHRSEIASGSTTLLNFAEEAYWQGDLSPGRFDEKGTGAVHRHVARLSRTAHFPS